MKITKAMMVMILKIRRTVQIMLTIMTFMGMPRHTCMCSGVADEDHEDDAVNRGW